MKEFEKNFIQVVNDYADDYDIESVLDELFPGMTIGEIMLDMYNLGGIPEDTLEKFLEADEEPADDWSTGI